MPPRFTVVIEETYKGSCHYHVTIFATGFGEQHPGWVLINRREAYDMGMVAEGSGIFRPEFAKELQRRLDKGGSEQ